MGKKFSYLLLQLVAMSAVFPSSASYAAGGGGMELVVFDCQPNHSLYIKGLVLYDVTPVLNKQTIFLDTLTDDQKVQECQLTPTDKVEVKIGANPSRPRNNNVTITLNGHYIDTFTYEHPNYSYTYIFTESLIRPLRIDYIGASDETKEKKNLTPGAGDAQPDADSTPHK
jgi:hypothetical protein